MIFQLPEFTVRVRPRGFDEELFPNEIDKTLATMQMVLLRLSLPVGSGARVVRDLCYDRIE